MQQDGETNRTPQPPANGGESDLPLAGRLAYNFHYYLPRLLIRLNLPDVIIKAGRHQGELVNVCVTVRSPQTGSGRPDDATGNGRDKGIPSNAGELVERRLKRVTRLFNIRYGKLKVTVEGGKMKCAEFTDLIFTEREDFSRYFAA